MWQIPAAELHTQRLYRVRYGGPEGEGSLRLTLRLGEPDRYRITTVDLAGRALWSLAVESEAGLWLDHREARYCRFTGPLGLAALPLSPFPLPALPSLLLGRVPAAPEGALEAGVAGRVEYHDAEGRRWTVEARRGEVVRWTLWAAGEPAVWWHRQAGEAHLSERRRGIQIRWREVVREPLADLPPPPDLPPSYLEACGADI